MKPSTADVATARPRGRTGHEPADQAMPRRFTDALDRISVPGMPKYLLLHDVVMELIRTGILKADDRLPPEQRLVELTGLSLGTVQRALRILTNEGIIERLQGRGSFIRSERSPLRDPWHFRFLSDDGALLPVYTRILSRTVAPAAERWAAAFPSVRSFVRLERLLDVNHEFSCYNLFYIDAGRFAKLRRMPMAKLDGSNMKHVLQATFGLSIQRLRHSIGLATAAPSVAERIGVEPGSICLILEILGFAAGPEPIYYQETFIPPSDRRLVPLDVMVRAS